MTFRPIVVGMVCFLLGASALAVAQTAKRIIDYPTDSTPSATDVLLTWVGGAGCLAGQNCTQGMPLSSFTGAPWTWTGSQRASVQTLTVASGTISTPNFNTGNDFKVTLSGCPCTLPNPTGGSIVAGQTGVFEITQGGAGSQTISSYGTNYYASTVPALSTAVGALDQVAYRVTSAGKIAFGTPLLNAH